MDLTTEEQKRIEFKKLLIFLAKSSNFENEIATFEQAIAQIENLYKDGFRHFYYDIFNTLTEFCNNNNPDYMYTLGGNISLIRTEYQPDPNNVDSSGNIIDVTHCIRKLYDHINLCIAQITYSDAENKKISGEDEIQKLKELIFSIKKEMDSVDIQINNFADNMNHQQEYLKETNKYIDLIKEYADNIKDKTDIVQNQFSDVQKKLEGIQKEYVAILGIFAAVVLAFTGGIAFSTSVLSNIHLVSTYKTIAIVLIIGLVLVNTLFSLFYYIDKIVHNNQKPKILPSIIANVVLLILLALTLWAWNDGWIENRNERFIKQSKQQPAITYQIEQNISS